MEHTYEAHILQPRILGESSSWFPDLLREKVLGSIGGLQEEDRARPLEFEPPRTRQLLQH